MNAVQVSVIIVSYNVRTFLDLCLDSVFRALDGITAEVFVVDNNSTDGSVEMVSKRYPKVHLIQNNFNAGFAKANNQAVLLSHGEFVHFLNPDTVTPEDFYTKTLQFMALHQDAGCLGPMLIDGKGKYAPDSKKAFPDFWTSVYKVTGLSKLFKSSTKFNHYYRTDLHRDKTAEVEILSGCCLLVRKEAMERAGGSFDETYFMFCEDVDLCYRLHLAGFKNFYFPEVSVIHYKGESTRKLTVKYMKIFYEAHALFVKKYYPKSAASLYIAALKSVLILRNFVYVSRHLFFIFKLFLFDTVLLIITSLIIKSFWFNNIVHTKPISLLEFLPTLLFFLIAWLVCLFLNGAYDKPFSLFKAGRGMIIGSILILAGYALFPLDYRFSRAVVLLSGMTGFVLILFFRWLLSLVGWIKLVPRGKLDYKAAIVSNEEPYKQTLRIIEKRPYHAAIIGRIAPVSANASTGGESDSDVLGEDCNLFYIQQQFRIDEFIFNGASISYQKIIQWMKVCSDTAFFKIQSSKSLNFIGSHYQKNNAETYLINQSFAIDTPSAKRNKRIVDLFLASFFLLFFPIIRLRVIDRKCFWGNIIQVFKGEKTWVGYIINKQKNSLLPKLKCPVLPPYKIIAEYQPDEKNENKMATFYAKDYNPMDDFQLIFINIRFLGNS